MTIRLPVAEIQVAQAAEEAFESALRTAGIKSRWVWHPRAGPDAVLKAYCHKVICDNAVHKAFEAIREEDKQKG